VHALSDASLLLLDAKDLKQAKNINNRSAKWLPAFLGNLKACLIEGDDCAFPGYKIEHNTTNRTICGQKFNGEYLDAFGYIQ